MEKTDSVTPPTFIHWFFNDDGSYFSGSLGVLRERMDKGALEKQSWLDPLLPSTENKIFFICSSRM